MSPSASHEGTGAWRFTVFSTLSVPLWLGRLGLWILPLTFLSVLFFYPLTRILGLTFDFDTFTSENLRLAGRILLFTFYQAALSTLFTLLLGLPAAYLFARYDFRGRSLLRALTDGVGESDLRWSACHADAPSPPASSFQVPYHKAEAHATRCLAHRVGWYSRGAGRRIFFLVFSTHHVLI